MNCCSLLKLIKGMGPLMMLTFVNPIAQRVDMNNRFAELPHQS